VEYTDDIFDFTTVDSDTPPKHHKQYKMEEYRKFLADRLLSEERPVSDILQLLHSQSTDIT
jgi:hypothetical protein